MWPTLDRTRRRLLGDNPTTELTIDSVHDLDEEQPVLTTDALLAIGRPEFDRLGSALQLMLGADTDRPDTPARLEAALSAAIERLGGGGRPRVTRRPAGLYTPEAWQIRLTDVEPLVGDSIRRAARDGRFG
jgi:hypothetical protein